MLKSPCMFLCFCYFVIGSYGNLAPFIDKCDLSDKACLIASAQKAIPFFCDGLPEFGLEPLDPLKIDQVLLEEGGLKVVFKALKVIGTRKCKMLLIVVKPEKSYIKIDAECPIDLVGHYDASGKLLFAPIEGNGPFRVYTNKMFISVKAELTVVDGADGLKHWKIGRATHTYEVKDNATFNLENLFYGDEEKAKPIVEILNQYGKELMQSLGKPIMDAGINKIISIIQTFALKVPTSELHKE